MNITGYRNHLKEMQYLLKKIIRKINIERDKPKYKRDDLKIRSLEIKAKRIDDNIPNCIEKIKLLQSDLKSKRKNFPRKSLKGRSRRGRRRMFGKK